ncbi:MAG: peroxiredoxin-like family protein [Planctomycetota bacterium]
MLLMPHQRRTSLKLTFVCCLAALASPSACGDETSETPMLSDQLEAYAAESAARLPAAMRDKFAQGIAEVEASGIVASARQVGDKMADATLEAPDGAKVTLSSLWAEKPLVISFYRGGWCPYCNLQLRALDQSLTDLGDAGATLVAITPELPEKVRETAAKNDLSLRVLTDRSNSLAREIGIAFRLPDPILPIYKERLGIAEYNGDERYELPLAATYIVDTTGTIRYAFLDADYKKRAEPAKIIEAVKQL